MKEYFQRFNINKRTSFTSRIDRALLEKLNRREQNILDIHEELIKVT